MLKIFTSILLLFSIIITAQEDLSNKFKLGQSYEQAGQLAKAAEIYRDLTDRQPWNYQYFDALNTVFIRLKKYDESIALVEDRIEKNKNDVNLYGLLGNSYYLKGENEKAFEVWYSALEINEKSEITYRIIANQLIQNRIFEEAIEILRKGNEVARNPIGYSYEIANILSITMKYKEATKEYCNILLLEPSQLSPVRSRMMNYLDGVGAVEESIEVTESIFEESENAEIGELLSFLYMQNNQYDKALTLILKLDKSRDQNGAKIFNFAREAFDQNAYGIANEAYKYIMEIYTSSPFIPTSKIGYAKSLQAKLDEDLRKQSNIWKPFTLSDTTGQKRYFEILDAYDEIIETYKNGEIVNEALLRKGEIYYSNFQDYKKADSLFSLLTQISPLSNFSADAYFRIADIAIGNNDLKKAELQLSQIIVNVRNNPNKIAEAKFRKGKIRLWGNDFKNGVALLTEVSSQLSQDQANDAIQLSMLVNTMKFDSVNVLKYLEADFKSAQMKYAEAAKLFLELSQLENSILVSEISKIRYAELMIALDKIPEVILYLESEVNSEKESLFKDRIVYLLAECYNFGTNNKEKAISTYDKLLENYNNSIYLDKSRKKINELKIL
ncbi:MAG: tetratricopeptide repeat protein [Melioribacteraceae bacterium]|nr:tetratricopeptide repeat protein [Melioribacteraceae bacterium]MCF8414201.1 tetratricopeptide repeat protein [Melioribacteraceae bacterium]MCF8430877.1 tetratricopeptide repeat protein [Melioribacteraceae bacterium]